MCRHAGLRAAMNGEHTTTALMALPVILCRHNVLMCSWTHSHIRSLRLREEIRNQYILPIGLSKEAGRTERERERPQSQTQAKTADLHLISSLYTILQHPSKSIKLVFEYHYLTLLPPQLSWMPPSDWQQFKPVKTYQGTGGLSSASPSLTDLQTYYYHPSESDAKVCSGLFFFTK